MERSRIGVFSLALLTLGFYWAAARAQDDDRPTDRPAGAEAKPEPPRGDRDRPHLVHPPKEAPGRPGMRIRRDLPPKPELRVRRKGDRPGPHYGFPGGPHPGKVRDAHHPGPPGECPEPKPPLRDAPSSVPGRPEGAGGMMMGPGGCMGPPPLGPSPQFPRPPEMEPPADPEMLELDRKDFELGHKCMELAMRFRHAPEEEKGAIRRELTELVNEHFEVRQHRRELQLRRVEEELERLRAAIERRAEAREQIVSKRIAELLGEEDDLSF